MRRAYFNESFASFEHVPNKVPLLPRDVWLNFRTQHLDIAVMRLCNRQQKPRHRHSAAWLSCGEQPAHPFELHKEGKLLKSMCLVLKSSHIPRWRRSSLVPSRHSHEPNRRCLEVTALAWCWNWQGDGRPHTTTLYSRFPWLFQPLPYNTSRDLSLQFRTCSSVFSSCFRSACFAACCLCAGVSSLIFCAWVDGPLWFTPWTVADDEGVEFRALVLIRLTRFAGRFGGPRDFAS